ncbi:hypothetical protein K2A41_004209 [Salmonella enterica subsp. enterica serovar Braenderup]|nr:hypothetical protein [Salmonella enterica subsp. enterica serovar Braenderup]EHX6256237.1 hypothetical protein [Salmonella enterica subsp. enterica serovar Braenderup]EJJ8862370.1 hypothetical protein [Salmonella enterica]
MKRGSLFQQEARRQASVIRQRAKWDLYPFVRHIVKRLLKGDEEVVRSMYGKGLTDVMASFYGITRSPGPRRIHPRSGRPYPLPYSVRDGSPIHMTPVYRQLTIDPWLPPREALAEKGIKIENSDEIISLLSKNDFKYGLRFTINPELAED